VSLAHLVALLAPPACAGCRVPLDDPRALVCGACLRDLRWLGRGVCRRCALPHHGGRRCPAVQAPFATAWAPLAYQGAARDLVRALKFRGALPLAGLMAAQVAANLPDWAGRGVVQAVVPVPPARSRRRRRGYDPAELLAREVARRLRLPVERPLVRAGAEVRQLGARRAERRAPGRVSVRAARPVDGAVLLLDDVHTTGATLTACAAALLAGGATRVHAVSYARVL
jgi:predicted amidophosphoribosyltransferase